MVTTLVLVSVVMAAAPSPAAQVATYTDLRACRAALEAGIAAIAVVYGANATAPHKAVRSAAEEGWSVLYTGQGRMLARGRCV
jgi:hypothetical protein